MSGRDGVMNRLEESERIERLFEEAARRPPGEREAFLEQACGADSSLRTEVESLLRAEEKAGGFLQDLAVDELTEPGDGIAGSLAPGRMVGAYQLQAKIGEGGMSTVYLAARADDQYRQRVAIKLVPLAMASADHLRRFRRERHILASLDHPNIARLQDAGTTEEGLPYFVMDYIEGESIDLYCDRHRLSIRERLELFRKICSTVHYAHQNLVVHRDLKPSNILVTEDGVPKLLDFGIAKLLNPELMSPSLQPTLTWHRVLTPDYASPEQVQGKTITTASDVYSLGVLLYKLLTGRPPHRTASRTPQEIERMVTAEEPEKPSTAVTGDVRGGAGGCPDPAAVSRARNARPAELRRRLAGDLDNIVAMALRKEPQRRYGSAQQLSEDLRRHLDGHPVLARQDAFGYRTGKFLRRHRWGVAVVIAFCGLISVFSVLLVMQSVRLARERDHAWQLLSYIKEVFGAVDPAELRGKPLAVTELLEIGMARTDELERQSEMKAEILNLLGDLYLKLGDYDRAEVGYTEALEIRRELFGEEHLKVAEGLSDLGQVLRAKGDYQAARRFHEQALAQRRRLLGEESSEVASELSNLADLANDVGEYETAERLYLQAIATQRELLGDDDPQVATLLSSLATLYFNRADLDESEGVHRQALELRRRALGNDHPEVAESLNNLAVVLEEKGQSAAAGELYREALELHRRIWGNEHPEVARTLNNLGVFHFRLKEYALAESLYEEALELRRKLLGEDHRLVALTLTNLAALKRAMGDLEASERLYRQLLTIWQRAAGPEHPRMAHGLLGLGLTLIQKGEAEAAEPLLRRAVALRRNADVGAHLIAYAESILGECLVHLSRFEKAEALLLASLEVIRAELGERHRLTRKVLERLVGLYEAWHKREEATRYQGILATVDQVSESQP